MVGGRLGLAAMLTRPSPLSGVVTVLEFQAGRGQRISHAGM